MEKTASQKPRMGINIIYCFVNPIISTVYSVIPLFVHKIKLASFMNNFKIVICLQIAKGTVNLTNSQPHFCSLCERLYLRI